MAKSISSVAQWLLFPGASVFAETLSEAKKVIDQASTRSIGELQDEITKQDMRLKFDLQQAKVAQELAIAQRISDAETVTIEEYYDSSGKGQLGGSNVGANVNFGLNAEVNRVSKRVYTFSGRSSIVQTENAGE